MTRSFRIAEVWWGYKDYVNLLVDGSAARSHARSSSDRNCFCVCVEMRGYGDAGGYSSDE